MLTVADVERRLPEGWRIACGKGRLSSQFHVVPGKDQMPVYCSTSLEMIEVFCKGMTAGRRALT